MKFRLTLSKVFDIDVDKDWEGDHQPIKDYLDSMGAEPPYSKEELKEAVETLLEDDLAGGGCELEQIDSSDVVVEILDDKFPESEPSEE